MRPAARASRTLVGVLLTASVAGCTASVVPSGAPTTATTPTYLCTPAAGGSPVACTPEQYTEEQRQAELTAQAKRVYTKLVQEVTALEREGGATSASAELSRRAGGPYLDGQVSTLTTLSVLQAKLTGDVKITKLARASGATERGYETALLACVDAAKSQIVQGDATLTPGRLIAETVYFKHDGSLLKAWDAEKANPKQAC